MTCLPFEEGFQRVTDVLKDEQPRTRFMQSRLEEVVGYGLALFRSSKTLEWMENHTEIVNSEGWGRIAALSHFSWPRAVAWLEQGRPLSHVALFAIRACFHYDTPQLQELQPALEEPAPAEVMLQRLDAYYETDPVTRVRHLVSSVREGILGST